MPDILFYEELDGQHAHLLDMGLQPKELDEAMVARVSEFATKYPRPGRNDLFALVLATSEQCPLLTGDKNLKAAAESENVEVRGTLWLLNKMVQSGKITVHVARNAYQLMRAHGRRLPWNMAEEMLAELETAHQVQ